MIKRNKEYIVRRKAERKVIWEAILERRRLRAEWTDSIVVAYSKIPKPSDIFSKWYNEIPEPPVVNNNEKSLENRKLLESDQFINIVK